MIPTKQTVYIPVSEFNNSERAICTIGIPDLYGDRVIEQEGYFFTPEQLNKYTANVIKQALETAAENAKTIRNKEFYMLSDVNKQSITNTFDKIFKHFKV